MVKKMRRIRQVRRVIPLMVLFGCGQVESLKLPQRPPREQFESVQKTMLKLGCSLDGSGCHAVLVGDFKVAPFPKAPNVIDAEFTLTKAFIDLDAPDESTLLRSSLQGDPRALGHPICFDAKDNCGYKRILAWVAYTGAADEAPDEACALDEVLENGCSAR